jgi:2-C-methyl-D-erythritol 4-phosphate cytidylyltransferase
MVHDVWGVILASSKDVQLTSGAEIGFLNAGTNPVITYSLQAFEASPEIDHIALVVKRDRADGIRGLVQMFGISKAEKVIVGTAQRMTSIQSAVDALKEDATILVLHDVSRPCVTTELITDTVKAAKRYGCSVAATRLDGVVKETAKGQKSNRSYDGSTLWQVQTPQAYRIEVLEKGLAAAKKMSGLNDPSGAMDEIKQEVHLVPSPVTNYRITGPDELTLVSQLLNLD